MCILSNSHSMSMSLWCSVRLAAIYWPWWSNDDTVSVCGPAGSSQHAGSREVASCRLSGASWWVSSVLSILYLYSVSASSPESLSLWLLQVSIVWQPFTLTYCSSQELRFICENCAFELRYIAMVHFTLRFLCTLLHTGMPRCWKPSRSAVKYVTVNDLCRYCRASIRTTFRWRFVQLL